MCEIRYRGKKSFFSACSKLLRLYFGIESLSFSNGAREQQHSDKRWRSLNTTSSSSFRSRAIGKIVNLLSHNSSEQRAELSRFPSPNSFANPRKFQVNYMSNCLLDLCVSACRRARWELEGSQHLSSWIECEQELIIIYVTLISHFCAICSPFSSYDFNNSHFQHALSWVDTRVDCGGCGILVIHFILHPRRHSRKTIIIEFFSSSHFFLYSFAPLSFSPSTRSVRPTSVSRVESELQQVEIVCNKLAKWL